MEIYTVRSFGRDCLGNITGYVVERYCGGHREIAGRFVGNLYEPGSFARALAEAQALRAKLNAR